MESGERIKARGQTPWAQKLLLEEINQREPCMEVIKEMRRLIEEIGLKITHTGEKYKAWEDQFKIEEAETAAEKKGQRLSSLTGNIGGFRIPMHLLDYFEMHTKEGEEKEAWERALEFMQEKKRILKCLGLEQEASRVETGLRLKGKTIESLERMTGHKVLEWGSAVDIRSTDALVTTEEIKQGVGKIGQLIIINATTPREMMNIEGSKKGIQGKMTEIMREAWLRGMQIITIDRGGKMNKVE